MSTIEYECPPCPACGSTEPDCEDDCAIRLEIRAKDERELERDALRREARQEAMLDAGYILAEHRAAKGEA